MKSPARSGWASRLGSGCRRTWAISSAPASPARGLAGIARSSPGRRSRRGGQGATRWCQGRRPGQWRSASPGLDDQFDDVGGCVCGPRDALGAPGAGFEGGLALGLVAGEELEQPGLGDAVLGGDVGNGSALDHHGGDQQSVVMSCPDAGEARSSLRDDSRHHSQMS